MGALDPTHRLMIFGALVVLFGVERRPGAARSLGQAARILEAEVHEAAMSGISHAQPAAALAKLTTVSSVARASAHAVDAG